MKTQIHFLFDLDFDHHPGTFNPAEIILPESPTVGKISTSLGSSILDWTPWSAETRSPPFLIHREGEHLLLQENGNDLCDTCIILALSIIPERRRMGF